MSSDVNEYIPIHSFELNPTALPTDSTKQHLRGAFPFVTLILYKGIRYENIYS